MLSTDKFNDVTQKGKYVYDAETLRNKFEDVDLTVKRILQSTVEDRKPTEAERLNVRPPFPKLPSFNVSALVLSYKCYEFEAPFLRNLSKNAGRYY